MPVITPDRTAMEEPDDNRRFNIDDDDNYWTAKQLGLRWGFDEKTIREKAQKGQIPHHILLGRYRFKKKAIKAYEAEHMIVPRVEQGNEKHDGRCKSD